MKKSYSQKQIFELLSEAGRYYVLHCSVCGFRLIISFVVPLIE